MKKLTNFARRVVYAVLVVLFGCVAEPELENADNAENGIPATRAQSDGKYYYAFDEKVPLYEVADRMVVTFDKEYRSSVEEHIMKSTGISRENFEIREGNTSDYSVLTVDDDSYKKAFKDNLSKQAGVKSVRQVYALDDGYEMGYAILIRECV